jgi:hypothetical protein
MAGAVSTLAVVIASPLDVARNLLFMRLYKPLYVVAAK